MRFTTSDSMPQKKRFDFHFTNILQRYILDDTGELLTCLCYFQHILIPTCQNPTCGQDPLAVVLVHKPPLSVCVWAIPLMLPPMGLYTHCIWYLLYSLLHWYSMTQTRPCNCKLAWCEDDFSNEMGHNVLIGVTSMSVYAVTEAQPADISMSACWVKMLF